MITVKNININIGEITIDTSKKCNGKEKEIEEVICQLINHIKTLFDKVSNIHEKVEILTSD